MARVKRGVVAKARHRKVLEQAKGYYGRKKSSYRFAKEQVEHSLVYAYRDRKARKRTFRSLWIIRINAAARENGLSYNRFMEGVRKAVTPRSGTHFSMRLLGMSLQTRKLPSPNQTGPSAQRQPS